MDSAKVFVPGKFRLTNQMLSDLRGAGYFEGYGRARYGKRPRAGHDAFAEEVEKIRMASFTAWKTWLSGAGNRAALPGLFSFRFFVTAHRRHDPDAWYLLAKPAIDGMASALWSSDRLHVWTVSGRVSQKAGEEFIPRWGDADVGVPGFFMFVDKVSRL